MDIGTYGVFEHERNLTPELARSLERLGYGAIWIGGSPDGALPIVDELLDATSTINVATGIVNIWKDDPAPVAASFHRIEARFPGRFLLGIGVGHPESTGARYAQPYAAMVEYLDALDAAGVPVDRRVLAALGPKMLRLAAQRSAGVHPYLVTPAHTRRARQTVGLDRLVAPEQRVVLDTDQARVRAVARPSIEKPYLGLVNYRNNLKSLGFDEDDLAGSGSDRLIDALTISGDADAVAAGLAEHLAAGADHVAVHLLPVNGQDPVAAFTDLAGALFPKQ